MKRQDAMFEILMMVILSAASRQRSCDGSGPHVTLVARSTFTADPLRILLQPRDSLAVCAGFCELAAGLSFVVVGPA